MDKYIMIKDFFYRALHIVPEMIQKSEELGSTREEAKRLATWIVIKMTHCAFQMIEDGKDPRTTENNDELKRLVAELTNIKEMN